MALAFSAFKPEKSIPEQSVNTQHPQVRQKSFDWHATSIRAILNNRVYLGKRYSGGQKPKASLIKRGLRPQRRTG